MSDDNQIDKVVQLFETMGTRHTTMAVSYTHLDVYKRQIFNHMKRKLATKYSSEHTVYKKLNEAVTSFKNSIPLIILLKNGSVTDRHW